MIIHIVTILCSVSIGFVNGLYIAKFLLLEKKFKAFSSSCKKFDICETEHDRFIQLVFGIILAGVYSFVTYYLSYYLLRISPHKSISIYDIIPLVGLFIISKTVGYIFPYSTMDEYDKMYRMSYSVKLEK